MKSALAFAAVALLVCAAGAQAKTFPIAADNPIATVSLPDEWGPNVYDRGVEATSPDGTTYIAVEAVAADDIKSAIEQGIVFFARSGVDIDPKSQRMRDIKINGLSAYDIAFSGKDKDGATEVSLTLVETNAKAKFLLLYYWASPDGEQANAAALKAISDSIQATK